MIDTERLHIRLPQQGDAPHIYDLMNSDGWIEHIGDRGIKELSDAERYIEHNLLGMYQEYGICLYALVLRDSGVFVGLCGLLQRSFLDAPDLGFAILPQHYRNGYTEEAAKGVMLYGHNTLGYQSLYAYTSLENEGSQQLLTKIGFSDDGTFVPDGIDETCRLFSYEF